MAAGLTARGFRNNQKVRKSRSDPAKVEDEAQLVEDMVAKA